MMTQEEIFGVRTTGKLEHLRADFVDTAHNGRDACKYYGIKTYRGSFKTPNGATYGTVATALVATLLCDFEYIRADAVETVSHGDNHDEVTAFQYYIEHNECAGSIRAALDRCHLDLKDVRWYKIVTVMLSQELTEAYKAIEARRAR